jgi:hypothetical protein
LKLPQLLAQFLYQNKSLQLPGIGVFVLDPSSTLPEKTEKEQPQVVQGIHFDITPVQKPDAELIAFIHKYTGKMKPLAESDLDSYLRLGIQLLNIGKPFYLEGIGSITKKNDGKYEFEPGEYSYLKLEMPGEHRAEAVEKRKKPLENQQIDYSPQSKAAKKILLVIGFLGAVVLIGWGGFNLYKNKILGSSENENTSKVQQPDSTSQINNDTAGNAPLQTDSAATKKKDGTPFMASKRNDSAQYKFVILATANKFRALRRYNQLISSDIKVKMETKDSSLFKVYFTIPAVPKDTLHIKDSLSNYYATKTTIEPKIP